MSSTERESEPAPKMVVGVGASAGGLKAFTELLRNLPTNTGRAYIFVQHLAPDHESDLTRLLSSRTNLRVVPATDEHRLEPDTLYVLQPGTELCVEDGVLRTAEPALEQGMRLPIDRLFSSLAEEYESSAVGILLSGNGHDGTSGLRKISSAGGLAVVQEPENAQYPAMPESAIEAGVVNLILPLSDIADALDRFERVPEATRQQQDRAETTEPPTPAVTDQEFEDLTSMLEARSYFRLSNYKRGTVDRRLLRRVALAGYDDVREYIDALGDDLREQDALLEDFLIGVTEFFRDANAFNVLKKDVLEPLVENAERGRTLRAWVPACSTGEEAYSIAMLLLEAVDAVPNKSLDVKVFATDINSDAIEFAREGVYPTTIADHVTSERRERFFEVARTGRVRVRQEVRDVISFALHDLTGDPPFGQMDLVSCRNLLIYLRPHVQRQVLRLLHFALNPGGHLLLGTSETTINNQSLFEEVSKEAHIYQKVESAESLPLPRSPKQAPPLEDYEEGGFGAKSRRRRMSKASDIDEQAKEILLDDVPPSVIVSSDGHIQYSHGNLRPYLDLPDGKPHLALSKMLRENLGNRVSAALLKCRDERQPVRIISGSDSDTIPTTRVTVRPAGMDDMTVVSFEPVDETSKPARHKAHTADDDELIEQLESELDHTRRELRETIEELETSNEELRASHEEAMSMNEELQSTNQELEASSEELRSMNEELSTVNAQLNQKVKELQRAHDDLSNFFASTKLATLFLDDDLQIERFTPAAEILLGLDPSIRGSSITELDHELVGSSLEHEARQVLEHLAPREAELRTDDDRWFTRRLLPYRTEDKRIAGVVVAFHEITNFKRTSRRLETRERQQAVVARLGHKALQNEDLQKFMKQVVYEVQQTLDTDYCKLLEYWPEREQFFLKEGLGWKEGLVGQATVGANFDSQAGYTLSVDEPVIVEDLPNEERFSDPDMLSPHDVTSGISCIIQDGTKPYGVISGHTRDKRKFTPDDANFLYAVANIIGSAVGRFRNRRLSTVERSLTRTLFESASLDEAAPEVIRSFAEPFDIDGGEIWLSSDDGACLSRSHACIVGNVENEEVFYGTFGESEIESGNGLIGRVQKTGEPEWIPELTEERGFVRAEAAEKLRLRSGFGFPIKQADEVIGVISVFSDSSIVPDDRLESFLEDTGRSIGEFVRRADAEAKLRDSERRFRATFDNAAVGIGLIGLEGEWLQLNDRFLEIVGYNREELKGKTFENITHPDDVETDVARAEALLEGEIESYSLEKRYIRKDGSIVWANLTGSLVTDSEGKPDYFIGIVEDITERKKAERALKEADRQKDQFLAMLGHELRNPLAALRSATELLRLTDTDDEKIEKTRQLFDRQVDQMGTLIDGLLDVSRIARGKISVDKDFVDLRGMLLELIDDHAELMQESGLERSLALPSDACWVYGDRARLKQVFSNLLTNAIKFTDSPGIITIELDVDAEQAVAVIRDTGAGIDDELLPHIFEPFRQAEQKLDRSAGGLGLGLALAKGIVEMHDGTIEAHSEGENRGSEFVVRLPTCEPPAQDSDCAEETSPLPEQTRILLVEDNEDVAHSLQTLLEAHGHQVSVAGDGREALEIAKEQRPEVILCDIGLPDPMDGYDVARRLSDFSNRDEFLLVALSGYGLENDIEKSKEAGFDLHLTKPVEYGELQTLLNQAD